MSDVSPIRPIQSALMNGKLSESSRKAADTNKTLTPVQAAADAEASKAQPVETPKHEEQLQDALGALNDYVQLVRRDLQFSLDDESGRTVVRVVDSTSGELIRQIPEEVFLELARNVKENGELNLLNATG